MSRTPRGWYQDPDYPEDPSRQRYWNGSAWSDRIRRTPDLTPGPPPPDIEGLRSTWLTFVAILLALVASVMAIPFFVQSFTFSALPGQSYPGWRQGLWFWAFFVGVSSFVLSVVSSKRERQRRSRSGKRFAGVALAVAVLGGCVWMFPAIIQASTGL